MAALPVSGKYPSYSPPRRALPLYRSEGNNPKYSEKTQHNLTLIAMKKRIVMYVQIL